MNIREPNPYLVAPSPAPRTAASLGIEELDTDECWRLLAGGTLGRLAVTAMDGGPDLFPVNYLVHDGCVFVRSAPGAKLLDIAAHSAVAFEIDGEAVDLLWSVVIRGTAQRLETDAEIEASGVLGLPTASPTAKDDFVRVTPDTVTGRRFPRRMP